MAYSKTGYGPGNIAALSSGAALSYGPTIGSNDPTSPQSAGGSRGAFNIPGMSGCGCGGVRGHAPVPMSGLGRLGSLLGLGACDENCMKFVKYGLLAGVGLFVVTYFYDKKAHESAGF